MTETYRNWGENRSGAALNRLLDSLIPARREKDALARQNEKLESFLGALPMEYCGWDQAGAQAVSPGFGALLGVDNIKTFQDIQAALIAGDAAALTTLFDRLAAQGAAFDLGIHAPATGKSLKIIGRRGGGGGQAFSVLWALDVTDFAQAAAKNTDAVTEAQKKEHELRQLLNILPFPVWMRNDALDLTWCNKFYARIVDDSAASVVAEQKELPMTGGSKNDLSQRVLAQRAMAKLTPQIARGHIIVDGERRLMEITEIPLPVEKRAVGAALDVTKEEELAASYERLATSQIDVLEQLRTAIAMFDADTRLAFYNTAYEQLTGLSGTWLDARPRMVDIIDKMRELRKLPEQADYKQFKQTWLTRFTSLIEPHEEMQYLPDGSVIRMTVLPRPTGGLLLTLEDVTSRLMLETSYNTLVAVQQETMDNLAEGTAVFGEDGKLRLSNQSFARMWRIAPDELKGAPHIAKLVDKAKPFFPEAEWAAARNTILSNALEREPRKGRLYRNDGTVLEYAIVPLPDGNILNAWFDITDTVKVEQALLEKNAALEAAERLKTDFLANVSYQLRTPLNAIMGFAEMLNQQYFGKLNDRQLEYTGNMIEAGQRLISLVNDILDLSTIEAGYLKLYPVEVKVKGLILQVTQLMEDWSRKQKLETVIDCPDDNLVITADERRIKQVLLNLISNAINYSPGGGTITIAARRDGDFVTVSVQDTGLGIPESDLARVFTPFEKIHSKKVRRRSGAGLGLALVKSIVEMHGGTVAIQSREGEGTLVSLRLPVRMAADTPLA